MSEIVNCNYYGCTGYDENQPYNCHHGCKDPSACDSYIWWNSVKADIPANNAVTHPSHYTQYPQEVITIIKNILEPEGFKAYCIGNEIKYRLRAGFKSDATEDINKAMMYYKFRMEA